MSQAQNYAELFARAYPKAIYFLETEYLTNKAAADEAAVTAGYRLAGYRLGRACFSTKAPRVENA